MAERKKIPNFIEASTVEEANAVDLTIYRFERYSETKGAYIFIKRRGFQ